MSFTIFENVLNTENQKQYYKSFNKESFENMSPYDWYRLGQESVELDNELSSIADISSELGDINSELSDEYEALNPDNNPDYDDIERAQDKLMQAVGKIGGVQEVPMALSKESMTSNTIESASIIRTNIEGIFSTIGNAVMKAIKFIIGLIKKFFNWIGKLFGLGDDTKDKSEKGEDITSDGGIDGYIEALEEEISDNGSKKEKVKLTPKEMLNYLKSVIVRFPENTKSDIIKNINEALVLAESGSKEDKKKLTELLKTIKSNAAKINDVEICNYFISKHTDAVSLLSDYTNGFIKDIDLDKMHNKLIGYIESVRDIRFHADIVLDLANISKNSRSEKHIEKANNAIKMIQKLSDLDKKGIDNIKRATKVDLDIVEPEGDVFEIMGVPYIGVLNNSKASVIPIYRYDISDNTVLDVSKFEPKIVLFIDRNTFKVSPISKAHHDKFNKIKEELKKISDGVISELQNKIKQLETKTEITNKKILSKGVTFIINDVSHAIKAMKSLHDFSLAYLDYAGFKAVVGK